MIFRPGLDPAGAVGTLFLFPERRARLELIHQILRRIEGRAAMRRRRRHKDYRLADAKRAPAMHCEYVLNGKERAGLGLDLGQIGSEPRMNSRHSCATRKPSPA